MQKYVFDRALKTMPEAFKQKWADALATKDFGHIVAAVVGGAGANLQKFICWFDTLSRVLAALRLDLFV